MTNTPELSIGSHASAPSATFAVLNYNRSSRVVETIRVVLQSDYPSASLQVLLLDNASTDRSVELVGRAFEGQVETYRSRQNIGPVLRNRALLRGGTDYVFMFDDDCTPESPDLIGRAIAYLEENRSIGAICFSCVNRHTGSVEFGHPGTAYRTRLDEVTWEGVYVVGGGMLFRRSALFGLEGYDERLGFGGEEYDLAMELLRNDVRIVYRSDMRIVHDQAPRSTPAVRANELDMRNNIWISFRRFPVLLSIPVALVHISRRLLSALRDPGSTRRHGYLRGVRSGLVGLIPMVQTRRPVTYRTLWRYRHWFLQMFAARPLLKRRDRVSGRSES